MDRVRAVVKSRWFMYLLIALFSLFLACTSKNYDYDLYARLIVGEHFFANGTLSFHDFLSYTPTHIWYDHEYGASLFYYALFAIAGPFGLVLSQALLMFLTAFWITKTQELESKFYPPTFLFSAGFLLMFFHLNPSIVRCHLFSFMFFALLLYILERVRIQNSKLIYAIPFLIILWNNIHGGVVAGLGIIFIYMLGEFFRKKSWKKYLIVLVISVPLLAINPWGIDYLNFLISANTKTRTYVTEWWHVFALRHIGYYYSAFIASVLTTVLAVKKKYFNLTKFLVLLTTTILGTVHVKLLSLPLIAAASFYYSDIMKLVDIKLIKSLNKAACILCGIALLFIPFTHPLTAKVDPSKFPVAEVEFLKINNIEGNVITAFGLGSYVAYKNYPKNLIYFDGRYEECYYDEEFNKLCEYEIAGENWAEVMTDYPTEILMPEKTVAIYEFLKQHKDWKEIYTGPVCGIFVRSEQAKNSYLTPSNDLRYYEKTHFDTLGEFGKKDKERSSQ